MKGPLAENLNITNMPTQHDTQVSISVLQRNSSKNKRSDIVDKKIHVRFVLSGTLFGSYFLHLARLNGAFVHTPKV